MPISSGRQREHGYVVDDVDNMPRSEIEYLSASARDGQRYGTDTLPNRMTRIIESVVVDLLDGINVDVSGSAGMGKSVLVRNVSKIISLLTGRDVILCAPTGIAAVNVHGRTVYSEFGGSYDLVEYLDNYVLNVKYRPSDEELARRKAERRAELDRDPDPQVRKRTVSNSDMLRDNECLGDQTTEYGVAHTEGFKAVNRPKGAADSTDADERRGWPQRFCGVEEFRDAWSSLYEWVPKSLRKRVVDVVAGFDGVPDRKPSDDEDEIVLKEWRKAGDERGGIPWQVDAGVGSPVARPGRAHFAPVSKALGDAWFEWFEPDADGGYIKIDRGDEWSYVTPRPLFDDALLGSGPDFD